MSNNLPPAGSRSEELLHRQIELQEETIRLLRDIKERMPSFKIVPLNTTD